MKRLLALVAGGLGLGAWLRRRHRPVAEPPVDELRTKLADARAIADERETFESGETPVDQVPDVDTRRAGVYERARAAMDELKET